MGFCFSPSVVNIHNLPATFLTGVEDVSTIEEVDMRICSVEFGGEAGSQSSIGSLEEQTGRREAWLGRHHSSRRLRNSARSTCVHNRAGQCESIEYCVCRIRLVRKSHRVNEPSVCFLAFHLHLVNLSKIFLIWYHHPIPSSTELNLFHCGHPWGS